MDKYKKVVSTREHVGVLLDKDISELHITGDEWVKASAKNRLPYEIDWLGVPIIQTPEDLILMQELIFRVKPDFVIETGIAHGGGLIFYASLMELLGKGKVIGVDIEVREHNRKAIEGHPLFKRIEIIEGSSTAPDTILKIKSRILMNSKVIVCLDSNHTKTHVLNELELYKSIVNIGGYIVVFDTVSSMLADCGVADKKYIGNSPKEAVSEFLRKNNDFEVDKGFNKLFVSSSPDGFLRRIK